MKICDKNPPKNDKLLEESNQWVQLFLKSLGQNDIFYDAEFNYSDGSLEWDKHGTILNYQKIKNDSSDSLTLYKDTWPFHAEQGSIGDCSLIAALMAISRRQKLLEWVIPPNDYSLKYGIFLVRLFYDDKWNMLAVDGHFPCDESGEVEFASLCYDRLWPSLIEKAVAKIRGGYHKLNGTCAASMFTYLTGASCLTVSLNKDTDLDMLWKKLEEFQSFGYLMVIGTDSKPTNKKISMKGLQGDHAYSLLELRVHEGHRLVLIGCPGGSKWNGKRSNLPVYKDEVMKGWSETERDAVKTRFSWIEIDDLCKRFHLLFVCKYHEDWYELRTGKVRLDFFKPERILRINIKEQCNIAVVITDWRELKRKDSRMISGLINIHRVAKNNQIGKLVLSHPVQLIWFDETDDIGSVETDPLDLDPGSYFVIFAFISSKTSFEYEFTLMSSSLIDHISYEFVTFENNLATHKSLLKMIESEKCGIEIRKGVVIHEYIRDTFLVLMAENKTDHILGISIIAKNDAEDCLTHGIMSDDSWKSAKKRNPPLHDVYQLMPGKSKCVIGIVWAFSHAIKLEKQPKKPEINCKYWIRILIEEMVKKYGLDLKTFPKALENYTYAATLYDSIPIN